MDFLRSSSRTADDNLTATVSPSIDSTGGCGWLLHWRRSCSFGLVCRRPSRLHQGGPGFSLPRFISFFVLITFAYCFVKFYDSSIPGIGYSLKGFISGGTSSLVDYIGSDSTQEVQNTIRAALDKIGGLSPAFTEPYTLLCTYTVN